MSALTDGMTAIAILERHGAEEGRRLDEKLATMRRLGIDHWSNAPEADRRSDAALAAKNDDMLMQALALLKAAAAIEAVRGEDG